MERRSSHDVSHAAQSRCAERGAGGIERPDDWRERVRVGADRKQSGTARENLTGAGARIPSDLPDKQKRMVDQAAPGLRSMLGYQ